MDVANLLSLGVRHIEVECRCGRVVLVDVSGMAPGLVLVDLEKKLRCSACGQRPVRSTINWLEYRPTSMSDDMLSRVPG